MRCGAACARTRRPPRSRRAPTCSWTGRSGFALCCTRWPRRLALGAVRRSAQDHRPPQRGRGDDARDHHGRRGDDGERRPRGIRRRRLVVRRRADRGIRRAQGRGEPADRPPARQRQGRDDDARAPPGRGRGQPAVAAPALHRRRRRARVPRAADPRHRRRLRGDLVARLAPTGVGRPCDRGARRGDVLRRADLAGAPAAARPHARLPARGALARRHGRVSVAAAPPPRDAAPARDESLGSIFAALAANTAIAVAKGTAAALTGSPALLAETLHTVADTGNELLLYAAIRRSHQPADASHPFGYGPERYYWALLAAIGMFVVGGAVSIWNGVRALIHPPQLEAFWVGVAVLVIALVLDGLSRTVALRQLRTQAARRELSPRAAARERRPDGRDGLLRGHHRRARRAARPDRARAAPVDRLRAPRRARLDPDRPAALLPRLRAAPPQPRATDQPGRARALRGTAPGAARNRGRDPRRRQPRSRLPEPHRGAGRRRRAAHRRSRRRAGRRDPHRRPRRDHARAPGHRL